MKSSVGNVLPHITCGVQIPNSASSSLIYSVYVLLRNLLHFEGVSQTEV